MFVSTHHGHAFVHDSVFIVGHHHHHCSDFGVGFAFGFGWGFGWGYPYYAYYSAYPYCYPYYPYYPYYSYYPYYYDSYYPYRYYPPASYVYHDAPPPPPADSSSAPAEAAPVPYQQPEEKDDITPIPPEEMIDRDRASSDRAPTMKGEIAERTALRGLAEFRSGSYSDAAESLFDAVQADPSSPTLKVYLAEALYAMGEYKFSAEYLRQAFEARPELIQKSFNLRRLYAPSPQGEQDLAQHYEELSSWTALRPYDTDALLVLGFVQLQSSRPADAGATLIALRDGSASSVDRTLAERLMAETEVRGGVRPEAAPLRSTEPADEDERLGQVLVASLED